MEDPAIAVEANEAEFLLTLGRTGGGEERDEPEITWTIGGSPIAYHNCVVRADLTPAAADAAIVASQELMRTKGVPGSWHVGPSMRPADLGERLVGHGFEGGPEPGMVADLPEIPDVGRPAGLVVETADLRAYEQVLAAGFGEGPKEAAWVCEMYRRLGDDPSWRHYVGRLDGEPVATATLFFAASVAGIYFVCTTPAFRGRGIGTAISRDAMLAARELGYATAVLGSSPMGQRVYERLGFREVCTVDVYEWSPD